MKKRIPTMVGLGILVVGLVVGVVFLGTGPGVFAPRATPETTPSKIKLTNVTDVGFTASFYTSSATPGFIKYGTDTKSIKSQTGDDRDQLSGTVGDYKLHHVTVRGLKPGTTYYYVLGTGSKASFDNNGAPFTVKTAARGGAPSAAKTAYGNVLLKSGSPANGAIVYATLPGVGEMSSLVKSSGSWAIPLSNARKSDGSGYAVVTETDNLTLFVQGLTPSLTSNLSVVVSESQPVADITAGEDGVVTETAKAGGEEVTDSTTDTGSVEEDAFGASKETITYGDGTTPNQGGSIADTTGLGDSAGGEGSGSSESAGLGDLAGEEEFIRDSTFVDFEWIGEQVITTQTPGIGGVVAPNVTVKIIVNSETQIEQELVADEDGFFSLNLFALQQNLEPGEHTATYTYTDPGTGEEVTKTVTFIVDPDEAGVGGSEEVTPFGSGNPFSIEDASGSGDATGSAQATDSGDLATRSAIPATDSAVPVSGSVGTTMALLLGGIFFIMAGGWSYYLATQIEVKEI